MASVLRFIRRLVPALAPVSLAERLRASFGSLIGILVTGLVTSLALGPSGDLPLLIAPMGASAVLLFAVPTSPLAQPWSIVGGNTVAALIGVTCAQQIGDPILAAAVAIGLSITAMMLLQCLHPPGGAVALTAVLGGPAVHAAGYGFAIFPVGANSLLLLITALAFNNLSGRRYPHLAPATPQNPHRTADPLPSARLGVTEADIEAVLAQYDQVVPVSPDELGDILHRAEMRAFERRSGGMVCGDIMSRDVQAILPSTSARVALRRLRAHHIKALPVVDEANRVIGIVTQTDMLDKAGRRFGTVADIMSTPVRAARPEMLIARIVPAMADDGLHHLPVVDADGKLVGMLTPSDLVAALFSVTSADPG